MKEKVDSPVTVLEDYFKSSDSESSSSKDPSVLDSESQDISKPSSKWHSFIQFLTNKSKKQIDTLDPLNRQFTRRMSRSRSMRESILPSCLSLTNATSTPCRSPWKIFSHHDIQAATNSFSQENLIGKGGYAEVYKGCLPNKQLVAIKRLTRGTADEIIGDFLSELGVMVHVNHPNTAKLVGYGIDGGMYIVLELSEKGSLASVLYGSKEKLPWCIRHKIALGTGKGILYLHEGCQRRIIHRDIKAANILLTEDFEPQICDFGLAKWLPENWTHHTVSKFEGTFGYLAPEYLLHGIVDEKTDVFAFGVLLLELVSGRRALDYSQQSLVLWAKPLLKKNDIMELIDPALSGDFDSRQMNLMLLAASLCIHQSSIRRPSMRQVVQLLNGNLSCFKAMKKSRMPFFRRVFREELVDSNSLRIISSCLKTVSTNATTVASTVRSAGASVAASISSSSDDHKDEVIWAGFDKLEVDQSIFKRVLLLGYLNGFQVLDVEDASGISELASKRDGPVSFMQMQPFPIGSNGQEGLRKSHPLLLLVAGDDPNAVSQNSSNLSGLGREGKVETQSANAINSATAVRFYSLKSHSYVHVLRFRSMVCMIRCSSKIVAVGLATQIYCFDALTLENKFSVLTHPVPQLVGQGTVGVNVSYGPMAVGPRWLAYASNNPLPSNVGCISPQNLSPSPGVSPSTSPSSGSFVARYAMESSKHLAAGIYKYCQEWLPDDSPVPSNSGWKVRNDVDNVGMVIIKDFVSRAIISQFKAHSSPISALCFDPSGTLLATASIYGNNINIFRIMPSCECKGSGIPSCDWSSSHVHLYRLHRGITPAMIQDICFSHCSQWIAIVSSKQTCHLFVLSPFGGDTGFQIISSQGEKPSLLPVLSLPWWSTPSSGPYQQPSPPPVPVILSVVSRIKYSSFSWLNTIHNPNANVSGKGFVPSGAIVAIFHNSLSHSQQLVKSKSKSLENLLVFTPSGHIVQHELLPSVGPEPNESGLRAQSASSLHMQDDEFKVKVVPIQWWDVCRSSEWPERGDPFCNAFDRQDGIARVPEKMYSGNGYGLNFVNISDSVGEKIVNPSAGKPQEKFHWYLSNAELQVNFGRRPIWQNSKIHFYSMNSVRSFSAGGESEIEKISANEVEIRQKELLPVFDHHNSIRPCWNERDHVGGKYVGPASQGTHGAEDKQTSDMTIICHSKPASLSSTESSDGGSSRRIENLLDLDQVSSCQMLGEIYLERMEAINAGPSQQNKIVLENSSLSENLKLVGSLYDHCFNGSPLLQGREMTSEGRDTVEGVLISDGSTLVLKQDLNKSKSVEVSSVMQNAHTVNSFSNGDCETLVHTGSNKLTEVGTDDVDSSSSSSSNQCERDQPEDEENDGILGDLFSLSE